MAEKLNEILPRPLKYNIVTPIVKGGKWSTLEPHSSLIALLDWTIKQKRQNRNMGYVTCVRICSKSRLFYAVRAGTEQEETVK